MTQNEAIETLRSILGYYPVDAATCSGETSTCHNYECMVCSIRDCRQNEPLHYHHDGCPACWKMNR